MKILDARRLTGPNVLWNGTGSVLDVACTADEADRLIPFCESRLREMLDAVGWQRESVRHVRVDGGASIAVSGPIDALYAASAISEWAWACCDAEFNGADAPHFDAAVSTITAQLAEEANPPLLALQAAARAHDVALMWDDDHVSVGLGSGSRTWPSRHLPDAASMDWSAFHDVPVGIVTGTNGKTTTVRIAKHILQSAGKHAGVSCTDWVSVNDRIIDRDDWSGPGGARMVLRETDVDVAVLETARGGLLRRGLGVNRADAAVITNVAEDHLGDFGSRNIAELLDIKWVISRAVAASGCLVLNADDRRLVEKSHGFDGRIVWFGLERDNPVIAAHVASGGTAFVYDDPELVRIEGSGKDTFCTAVDVPITLAGAARHNVANALAAAALTEQLGVSLADIRRGLTTMVQDANPGRSNLYDYSGVRVLVDFAHNPQAMQMVFGMARQIPAMRRALCFGQAGDRTDRQIRDLARQAWSTGLDLVCVAELEKYRRGREIGEVYTIIRDELLKSGARAEQIRYFGSESESFDAALDWAQQDDLVVILDLGRNSDIQARLKESETNGV